MNADLSQFSMADLFRVEAASQTQMLVSALLALEQDPTRPDQLEACMRAAHSLKGAARIVDVGAAVTLAHAMEELFVAAQEGRLRLGQPHIDALLKGADLIMAVADLPDHADAAQNAEWDAKADGFVARLQAIVEGGDVAPPAPEPEVRSAPAPAPVPEAGQVDEALRVSVDNLNRLLDLAGGSLVESRRLKPFGDSLSRLKRLQRDAANAVSALQDALSPELLTPAARDALALAQDRIATCRSFLTERIADLDVINYQATTLAHRLYDQALLVRMRPFGDGIVSFPRMVRDVSRVLGKQVRLEVVGADTKVDRNILERLEAPLGHLVSNAVDHGIEMPEDRLAAGKPAEGVIRLEARHSAGMLQVTLTDDGRGVDLERVRRAVVERKLATPEMAERLSESELLEFLFLPGFSMKGAVTEVSGRGFGLDVVQDMVKKVGGLVRVSAEAGQGTRFQLQLPLTLSVIRALLVEIGGEPYAFPLTQVVRTLKIARGEVQTLEGRQHFTLDGRQIGLVPALQVLGSNAAPAWEDELAVVLVGSQQGLYGLVIDRFVGGRELVVQPLDPRLGKVQDVSAGALMEDGTPLLILDVEDMIRSIEKLSATDRLHKVGRTADTGAGARRKRVLVVDDSFTVRELQRKILDQQGYDVEVAVDGMDGWHAVRNGGFDLVISDIDMPRMDGIELVGLIRKDPELRSLPVMILSYKDREEDRRRGLDAGADYYLTKGSYQKEALLQAVVDLVGEAEA